MAVGKGNGNTISSLPMRDVGSRIPSLLPAATLKSASRTEKVKKLYVFKIKIISTKQELNSFKIIQELLFKLIYLFHYNAKQQRYVDFDFSKKIDIEAMIYHFDRD